MTTGPTAPPVAIVGMAALFPGAEGLEAFWRNIASGADAISEVPSGRWDGEFYAPDAAGRADRVYCRRGGFIDSDVEVDVTRFGIMPSSVAGAEPDQLIALRVAASALADAGAEPLPADRQRAGIVLGRGGYLTPGLVRLDQRVRTVNQLMRTLRELVPELAGERLDDLRAAFADQFGPQRPEAAIGLVPNLAASRVANRLDLRGPAYTVDAACASSLVAVDQAVRELAAGRCDVMLAGGVHHCHDITLWSVFSQLGALSRSQRIRPFHRNADGVLIGEGTGVVVLKRLADAERAGDRIYAVITGTGVASDGRSASLFNPDPSGQVRAVRQAWAAAGLDPRAPEALGMLEAHGTATPAGDTAELTTVAEVFGPANGTRAVIGSVKSMIGHAMPAAGIAGLIKAALAIHHRVLPPTLHCEDPHPGLDGTRFTPLAAAKPWQEPESGIRRAGVNAFGFGGINAHVVLQQAQSASAPDPVVTVTEPERVLRLAAADPGELAALLSEKDDVLLGSGLDERSNGGGPCRLGIVGPTRRRLALARKVVAKGIPWAGRGDVWFLPRPLLGASGGRVAFIFPGLEAEFEPNVASLVERFGLRFGGEAGARVDDVGRHGAAVFQLGRLLDAALRRLAVVPDAVAGHSVGEWTAMVCGGIFDADEIDAFLSTFDPDELRVPGVVFAALGAPAERVLAELAGRSDVVLSHDNSPNQSMICGAENAVGEIVTRLRATGVLGQLMPFRSGFHTPMLAPYLEPIRRTIQTHTLHQPATPVWSATIAAPFPADPAAVRELFVRHLLEPVRFRSTIDAMHRAGVRAFVQLGAGQVGSLIGDTLAGREHLVVAAHAAGRDSLAQLRHVVTALWAAGAAPAAAPLLSNGHNGRSGTGVRLDLGGALVSLPESRRQALSGLLRREASAGEGSALAGLDRAGERFPVAAELSALLRDTAAVATELIGAGGRQVARPAQARVEPPADPRPVPSVLRFDVGQMPYLLDHCFFHQRPGWPDDADRWPVVPATTVITHLMAIAERAVPGRHAVAARDVRLLKWIVAAPPVDVPVRVIRRGPNEVEVHLAGYSSAIVELAPERPPAGPVWTFDAGAERAPETTAAQLYDERWMFHGPRFQGIAELTALGERHVRGVLTALPAPGALLDNAGQLLGYWIMVSLTERTTVLPVRLDRVSFHAPDPPPGERLSCAVRITEITETTVSADLQLVRGTGAAARVWAQLGGWTDRRFDTDPGIRLVDRFPGRHLLSTVHPEGWAVVHERWPDLATRDLLMRNVLGGAERIRYERLAPGRRRQWLLGRIAAKDAARTLLWQEEGPAEIYPAELAVHNDDTGRPVLCGVHGRRVGEVTISIAHRAEAGVAIASRDRCGIDIEEITDRPAGTVISACAPAERALLYRMVSESDASERSKSLWFTRFWAAKEAVAKARGIGLRGRPTDYAVVAATADHLYVRVAGELHSVSLRRVSNPPSLPARDYIVAWTTGMEKGRAR